MTLCPSTSRSPRIAVVRHSRSPPQGYPTMREPHGRITKRAPMNCAPRWCKVVLGLVRNKRRTDAYRIVERYDGLKRAKGGLGAQYHRNGSGAE